MKNKQYFFRNSFLLLLHALVVILGSIPTHAQQKVSSDSGIPFLYDKPLLFVQGKSAAFKNNKWGLIDKNNKLIIPFLYDKMDHAINNFVKVSQADKWGYFRTDGTSVIPVQYDFIEHNIIYNNFIVALNGKYGVISNTGEILIPIKFSKIERLKTHNTFRYYICEENEALGIIDMEKEKLLVSVDYATVELFNRQDYAILTQDTSSFIFDLKKEELHDFSSFDTVQFTRVNGYFVVRDNGKYGVVKLEKKEVLPTIYEKISFVNDLALFKVHKRIRSSIGVGLIDTAGQIVVPILYQDISLPMRNQTYGKYFIAGNHLYSLDGKTIVAKGFTKVNCNYDKACYIIMFCKGDSCYFKDMNTERSFSFEDLGYKVVTHTANGFFIVEKLPSDFRNKKLGVVDREGNIVVPPIYNKLVTTTTSRGAFIGFTDSTYVIFNPDNFEPIGKGKYWTNEITDKIQEFFKDECAPLYEHYGLKKATKGKLVGFVFSKDEIIIPIEYEDNYYISDHYLSMKKDGKWGALDLSNYLLQHSKKYTGNIFPQDMLMKIEKDFSKEEVQTVIDLLLNRFMNPSQRRQTIHYGGIKNWDHLPKGRQVFNSLLVLAEGDIDTLLKQFSILSADPRDLILKAQRKTGKLMCEVFRFD